MVEADVAGEPLQDPRQLVVRAALKRRGGVVPILIALPVRVFELVLNVKKPYAAGARHHQHHRLQQQIGAETEQPAHRHGHTQQREVHPPHGVTFSRAGGGRSKALTEQKHVQRRDDEQHEGIAHELIREPFPARRFQVLLHRHGPHVADASLVQVPGGAVVNAVLPAPVVVRCERQDAGDESDQRIGPVRLEERPVPAIVKEDEHPHQQRAGEHRQRKRQPQRDLLDVVHEVPEQHVRNDRIEQLPQRAPGRWPLVQQEDGAQPLSLVPVRFTWRAWRDRHDASLANCPSAAKSV